MLTEGVPAAYRNHLSCCPAVTPVEWLKHALKLEANVACEKRDSWQRQQQQPRRQNQAPRNPTFTAKQAPAPKSKSFAAQNVKPRMPCRYCENAGQLVYHWHSECQRRQQLLQQQHSNNSGGNPTETSAPTSSFAAQQESSERVANGSKNSLCDRH